MRRILLGATPAVFWLAVTPAAAQQAITTPILASDPNFRDLAGIAAIYGGTGFADVTAHDGVMRTGVFYRSEALNGFTEPDFATLSSLNITQDIDLRTPQEYNKKGDRPPTGATIVHVNIYGSYSPPSPFPPGPLPTTRNEAAADFAAQYRLFVSNATEASGFGTALLDLAHSDGSVLYHCSGGKDRTGWTSFLLQTIAGVDMTTRRKDYLATKYYTAAQIDAEYQAVKATYGQKIADIISPLLGVQSSFLDAAIDQVSQRYPAATFDASMYASI
jgi:protein tyrosine/serine phosphatase